MKSHNTSSRRNAKVELRENNWKGSGRDTEVALYQGLI